MRATGRDLQLTTQIGEHFVVAELGRRGYLATPFAGNVPMFDLLVADLRGYAIPVQVKAINGGAWQFSADRFLRITNTDAGQKVDGRTALLNPELVCIFVLLRGRGTDEFYVFQLRDLQDYCASIYKPRGLGSGDPTSLHCAVGARNPARFLENWSLLESTFAALDAKELPVT